MRSLIVGVAFVLSTGPLAAESLMAARVIRANAIIQPIDVAISEVAVPGALDASFEISGLEARITLYPGRPIMPTDVGPAALVTRNQPVSLIYRNGALSIVTEGRSLGRAGAGDTVRVMNLASRSTVVGWVRADGSVEVTTERMSN